jgi:limonene-1,2-epoxide hydrolase
MSNLEDNRALITRFWSDLYRRDFAAVAGYFAADGVYEDVPVPEARAVGPNAVERKLRIGLDRIEKQVHHLHRMVAEGDVVVTEHTEDWHFGDGVVVSLPFVSVHVVEKGKIVLWRDYWNFPTLMSSAPRWWLDHIMKVSAETPISG